MAITQHAPGRIVFVTVSPGDCLQATLEQAIGDAGASAAIVLTTVGSLTRLVFANPGSLDKDDRRVGVRTADGPLEIVSLVGGVGSAYQHGEAQSHLHISVSRPDGQVIGGSLRYGSTAWFQIQVRLLLHD
ncbi:MAG: DNA-binding protein [Burkholderiaceae bacterium]|nr:DNA-binding protein [Burkholderiaceae bacterium]